jgi:hypothetical protein
VAYDVIRPDGFEWLMRPHEPGKPARHVGELSARAGFAHVRGNVWRYKPGARRRRHRTVKDLVAGSGFEFVDRGVHDVNGVPGEWRLYAAV